MGATAEFGAEQGPDLTDVLFKQKRKLLDVGESETGASLSPPKHGLLPVGKGNVCTQLQASTALWSQEGVSLSE